MSAIHDMYADCTEDCERMPTCWACGRTKKPVGRDAPMQSSYCDSDCPEYRNEPTPGHLWPGELSRIYESEATRCPTCGERPDINRVPGGGWGASCPEGCIDLTASTLLAAFDAWNGVCCKVKLQPPESRGLMEGSGEG